MRRIGTTLLLGFALAGWGSGCTGSSQHQAQIQKMEPGLPLPTKDDVLLVDGRSLSLSLFSGLRERMKRSTLEEVLWVGEALLLLQNDARNRGLTLDPDTALSLARYASEELPRALAEPALKQVYGASIPEPFRLKSTVDALRATAVVHRNTALLAEFH